MENLREIALQVIDNEANSILGLKSLLTDDFEKVVELIYNSKGNVIVSGIGTSGWMMSPLSQQRPTTEQIMFCASSMRPAGSTVYSAP